MRDSKTEFERLQEPPFKTKGDMEGEMRAWKKWGWARWGSISESFFFFFFTRLHQHAIFGKIPIPVRFVRLQRGLMFWIQFRSGQAEMWILKICHTLRVKSWGRREMGEKIDKKKTMNLDLQQETQAWDLRRTNRRW